VAETFNDSRLALLLGAPAAVAIVPVSMLRLFLSFLKIGSVVFGSGYVLLAFLRAEFIDHLHCLTEKQLIDAVAVGQFTPGPVFTTATLLATWLEGYPVRSSRLWASSCRDSYLLLLVGR
jgi:chromate transporter